MRYKLTLMAKGKYVTSHLSANSVEQLAHLVASLYPGYTLVSCQELAEPATAD